MTLCESPNEPRREKTCFSHMRKQRRRSARLFCVALFRLVAWRYFVLLRGVISSFRVALFRLFPWRYLVPLRGVISSCCVALFRLFAWRYFVIFRGVFSLFRLFAWRYFSFLKTYFCFLVQLLSMLSAHKIS